MKNSFKVIAVGLLFFPVILNSCKKEEVPALTTSSITNVTGSTATCGGTITDEGSGTIIERGVCWSKEKNPAITDNRSDDGGGAGNYTSNMTNLNSLTTYYVRAYATNKFGTGYGNEINFQTAPPKINFNGWIPYDSVTDQDNNIYRIVNIGEQTWMAENLRAIHYQDGSPVQNVTDIKAWIRLNNGAYCFYGNDTLNKNVYGVLYNWFTVADPHKICPAGWHVPSDNEWTVLENYLGGSEVAGMKIKETGLRHWVNPNLGASNESGFTALPSGSRYFSINDDFLGLRFYCMWWSSTEHNTFNESAWYRSLNTSEIVSGRNYYLKKSGFSIRCVMD